MCLSVSQLWRFCASTECHLMTLIFHLWNRTFCSCVTDSGTDMQRPIMEAAHRNRTRNYVSVYCRFTVHQKCNSHCACSTNRKSYKAVCGSDNVTYFSACFAGCTDFTDDVSIFFKMTLLCYYRQSGTTMASGFYYSAVHCLQCRGLAV